MCSDTVLVCCISAKIIEEDEVEVKPEKIAISCLDESVCLESTRKYYTQDACMAVESVVQALRDNPVYYCGICTCPISDEKQSSIVCDCCLSWYVLVSSNLPSLSCGFAVADMRTVRKISVLNILIVY